MYFTCKFSWLQNKKKSREKAIYVWECSHNTSIKTIEEKQFKFHETAVLALCLYVCGTLFISRAEDKIAVIVNYIFENNG